MSSEKLMFLVRRVILCVIKLIERRGMFGIDRE